MSAAHRLFLLFLLPIISLLVMFQPVRSGSAQAPTPTPTFLPSPTPVRPTGGASTYQLKQWREGDAQSVVTMFDEQQAKLQNMDYEASLAYSAYNNLDFNSSAALLEKETLIRFPDSANRDALSRQLLKRITNLTFYDDPDVIELLRVQLEEAINASPKGSAVLEDWLKANLPDMIVISSQTVPDLFGAGRSGELIELNDTNMSVLLAIQTEANGKRHVYPIQDHWEFSGWSPWKVTTEDLNGNGLADIAVQKHISPTGFIHWCEQYIDRYEWNGQRFVEYGNPLGFIYVEDDLGTCAGWEYRPGDQGTKIIISHQNVGGWDETPGFFNRGTRYAWNGTRFEWAGVEIPSPANPEDLAGTAQWAYEAGPHNEQSFGLLKKYVQNWSVELEKIWGPAAQDFIRYKLGLWYAFRGDASSATTLLTQVRDHPTHPEYDTASHISSAFLQGYQTRGSFAGCSAVIDMLSKEYYSLPWPRGIADLDAQQLTAMWGFYDLGWNFHSQPFWPIDGRGPETPICSLAEAFQSSLAQAKIHSQTELIAWLGHHRIPWNGLHAGDLNGDGHTDWLVIVTTGENFSRDLWALIQQPAGILAIQVGSLPANPNTPTAYQAFQPAQEAGIYHAYQAGQEVVVFHLVQADGQVAAVIIATGQQGFPEPYADVAVQRMDVLGKAPQQQLFIRGADGVDGSISWDATLHQLKLTHTPLRQAERVVQIETMLLTEHKPVEAQRLILSLMRGGIYEEIPDRYSSTKYAPRIHSYLTYLLGLTYELTGEPVKAAQTYYQLWYDYPDNPYALIVRAKLERNP